MSRYSDAPEVNTSAYELGVSASTVGVLLWRVKNKLGVNTLAELAARLRTRD